MTHNREPLKMHEAFLVQAEHDTINGNMNGSDNGDKYEHSNNNNINNKQARLKI